MDRSSRIAAQSQYPGNTGTAIVQQAGYRRKQRAQSPTQTVQTLPGNGLDMGWTHQIRGNFRQGQDHEGTLPHTGMRNLQVFAVHPVFAIEQDVEIQVRGAFR